jgi:dynein heavy chain
LENIFASPDIKTKLKDENTQFENVDKVFKTHMRRTNQAHFVSKVVTPGLLDKFRESKDTLANIQKKLENYLEDKRNTFPRFYFLSNDELLEILAKS